MWRTLMTFFLIAAAHSSAEAQRFEGKLELSPLGCEKQLECTLLHKFGFIDKKGLGWQAAAGLKTDGASIPEWAQPFVGGQFEKEFIKAAVIHDHYCDRRVRTWRKTHWVFYEALRASGVSEEKSWLMYFGVYLGGPRWIDLVEGRPCSTGRNCIHEFKNQILPQNTARMMRADGRSQLVRPAEYGKINIQQHLKEAESYIIARGGTVTRAEMEMRANSIRVGDFFALTGSELLVVPTVGVDR